MELIGWEIRSQFRHVHIGNTRNNTAKSTQQINSPDEAILSSKLAYGGWANFLLLARACALAAAIAPTLPNVSFFVAVEQEVMMENIRKEQRC